MRRAAFLVLATTAAGAPYPRQAPPASVVVFAAASLARPFRELADSLARRSPGLQVTFNFAGSQTLALQLQQGAAADVFASADQRWMSAIVSGGLSDAAPKLFARNRLAVIVPASNPGHIVGLADLARRGARIDLAADAVPAGRYSREALANLGHQRGFPADFAAAVAANVVSNEENVEAVAVKVSLGEADAGIVYRSDAMRLGSSVRMIDIPNAANVVAEYPVTAIRGAPHAELARTFIDALVSPLGQRILAANGFDPAIPSP